MACLFAGSVIDACTRYPIKGREFCFVSFSLERKTTVASAGVLWFIRKRILFSLNNWYKMRNGTINRTDRRK